jgi:hypothetical protein
MRGKLWALRTAAQGDQVPQDEDDEAVTAHTWKAQVDGLK